MKNHFGIWITTVLLLTNAGFLHGAPNDANQQAPTQPIDAPAQAPYAATIKDGNSRVWQQTTYEQSDSGQVIAKTNRYTELASGLYYSSNGQWVESKQQIDIQPDGTASATQGQHQAYFPGDIYQGQIEVVTPDGQHLKSRPMGLSYFDGTNSVLIAELKDTTGQLVSSNQVIYPDAFTDFKADLRYTYTKGGFEQDVILREQPPVPEAYNLNSKYARLQVLTEFFNPPQPQITEIPTSHPTPIKDERLKFGTMRIGLGRAFVLGIAGAEARSNQVFVTKQFLNLDGRDFLVEEVPVAGLKKGLSQLPTAQNVSIAPMKNSVRHMVSSQRLLPEQRLAKTVTHPMQLAKMSGAHGYVLDYTIENGDTNDFTFQSGETYYISSPFVVEGNLTIGDGAVIKIGGFIGTGVECDGSIYSPGSAAYFTSADDDSIGDTIPGSSGAPGGLNGFALSPGSTWGNPLCNLIFSYGGIGLSDPVYIHDCQFYGYSPCIEIVSGGEVHIYSMKFSETTCAVHYPSTYSFNSLYASDIGMYDSEDFVEFPSIDSNVSLYLTNYTAHNSYCPACEQDICAVGLSILNAGGQFYSDYCDDYLINGLPMWWQLQYFGNFDQTASGDYDGDGVSNLQEYQNGTDPTVYSSAQLGRWRFDNTNNWVGDAGQLPLQATNLTGVPSWNTNAVQIDSTNVAILKYHDIESSGNANINLRSGTIRFWFKPDWSSTNAGGVGPLNEGRFIEMGTNGSTAGWWGLSVRPSGTNIYFGTQTNLTTTLTTNLSAAISWTSNVWHQVVLTYATNNSSLYLDGQPVMTNGLGVAYYPNATVRANGFTVGSSASGTNQVRGQMDELETFNYGLSASSISNNYQAARIQILSQPQDQNVVQGMNATFSVAATGPTALSYQWRLNGTAISGATGSSHTKLVVQTNDAGGSYSVVISNSLTSVTSSIAVLSVTVPLVITNQPVSQTVIKGTNVSFSFGVSGNYLVYQWFAHSALLNNNYPSVTGATSSTITLSNVAAFNGGSYSAVVANLSGSVTSSPVTLTVITNPRVTLSPTNKTVVQSEDVTFYMTATSVGLGYQWWLTNSLGTNAIAGATNANYTKLVVQTNDDGHYSVIITNAAGGTNAHADLTVLVPPWITQQPSNILTNQGSNVTFTVSAIGTTPLSYQWFKFGTNAISGATSASLTLSNVQTNDACGYSVLVTNIAGTNFSAWAWLSVTNRGSVTNGWGNSSTLPSTTPVVSMISPTNAIANNAAVYLYGPPISIRARASSQYGYITNVVFYYTGTNYVTNFMVAGTAVPGANTKFALAWTNALPGTNILRAVAQDINGLSATSSVVYVIMDRAPVIFAGTNQTVLWPGKSSTLSLIGSVSDDGLPYSVTNISWSVLSGNGNVTFTNQHAASTAATFTNYGTYVLQLQADDGFASSAQTCTITIRHRPVASITAPTNNAVFLVGTQIVIHATAYEPAGMIASMQIYDNITNLLGTALQSIGNTYALLWANAPSGTHILSAKATDATGLIGTSYPLNIIVEPTNQPPSVNVGPNQTIYLSTNAVQLVGLVSDDGLPYGSTLSVNWTNLSGGTNVTFVNSNLPIASAYFWATGTYVLRLSASDSQYTTSSNLTITVLTANQPPVVYAGSSQNITNWNSIYPSTLIELQGVATDDGLPTNGSLIPVWSVIEGPGTVTFANPNLTNTSVVFSQLGTYQLRLTASDGQLASSSDVIITVTPWDLIPYQATGYRYRYDDGTSDQFAIFQATNFDDSSWSIGAAAFGTTNEMCIMNDANYVKTDWSINRGYLLVRRHFNIPPGTTNLNMAFTVDNNAQVYINGVLITTNVTPNLVSEIFQDGSLTNATLFQVPSKDPSGWACWPGYGWYIEDTGCPGFDALIFEGISTNLWHTNDNVLAVCAQDCGGAAFLDMRISTTLPLIVVTNQPPAVYAGLDQYTTNGVLLPLNGLVVDDGLPGTGQAVAAWTNISGPGTVTLYSPTASFTNLATVNSYANFSVPGTYVLRLVANDGELSATDTVTVVVDDGSIAPPVVNFVTPVNDGSFPSGMVIPITATASATTGIVAKVEFFVSTGLNDILIGSVTNSPYTMNWINPNVGNYSLLVLATDAAGRIGSANINVQIQSNRPPVAVDDQLTVQVNIGNNIFDPRVNDSDPDGDSLMIISNTPPGGGAVKIVNNGTAISYTPPSGIYGSDYFSYEISDGKGGTASAGVSVNIDGGNMPSVTLAAGSYVTNAGNTDPITASIAPSQNIVKVDFYLGQDKIGELTNGNNGIYTLNWIATYDSISDGIITASATDKFGQVGVAQPIHVTVTPPISGGQAVAVLDSIVGSTGTTPLNPTNLNMIRDGLFQLNGRAYHSLGSNVVWQVGIYTIDGTFVRNLNQATAGTVGSSSMSGDLLTCDLTTLMNGVYDLRLTVSGGYTMTDTNILFRLESNLKIGQFGFSQQDLVIPVNGIPLTVTRTYNSINPNKGDFGYGWTYSLSDMDVILDETREDVADLSGDGDGDSPSGIFNMRTGGGYDVTLTLPNGQRTTFYFYLNQIDSYTFQAAWQAAPGVTAKLTAQGNANFYNIPGYGPGWVGGVPFDNFDIEGFILTTQDGTQYYINREDLGDHSPGGDWLVETFGTPYLAKIVQRSGDTITINPDSIVHIYVNGATNRIVFQRNDEGLISSISDPNGLDSGGNPTGPPAVKYEYDNNGNLMNVLNLVDRNTGAYVTNSFAYTNVNFQHYITGIINADGTQVAKNFYDDSGKLTAVQDADGNLTKFIHNLAGNMEVIIDRLGNTNTYVYDLRGNVIFQTNQLGQVTQMAYDINNNKTNEIVFLNGQPYATNCYAYDTNLNLPLLSTDPLGHTNSFVYDYYGEMLTNIDARGNSSANIYDGSGNLVVAADALGNATTNFYDGSLMLGSRDAVGTTTTNYYDNNNNLISTATLDVSGVILSSNTFVYDDNGNRTNSVIWRRNSAGTWIGAATVYIYDAQNRVTQTIDPDLGTNIVIYNAIGKQQATIDKLGRTNSYVYDALGRLVTTTYPDLTNESNFYDANGNRTNSVDRAGRSTIYAYDVLNRLQYTIYPDNTTNTTVYDNIGRVAQTIDALGTITAFAYDTAGRRLAVTNAFGMDVQMVSNYGYDENGNQITFTDALGHTTTNVFDALNRQVQVLFSDGTKTSTGYDAVGRRVAETNQDTVVTLFGYDGAGRLTAVTNAVNKPEQMVTRYQYDEAGNESAQIDGLNRTNSFAYDDMGRRTSHVMPTNSLLERFSYDLAGNLVYQTNFNGVVITNQYDVMNRLTNRSSINGYQVSYTYTATGQRQTMADPSATTSYSYNTRDRLQSKTVNWINGPGYDLSYTYDKNGNTTHIYGGVATDIDYNYDELNRLTDVFVSSVGSAQYNYDAVGNLQSLNYGNNVTNLYQYDCLNRLTNMVWGLNGSGAGMLAKFAYQLQAGGSRTNLSEMVNGVNRTYAWSYDNLYRLTNEVISSTALAGNLGYRYDVVGNRTNRTVANVTGSLGLNNQSPAFNPNDWLMTDKYDNNGNTTNSSSNYYQYDPLNHLANVNNGQMMLMYDGDGNRVWKAANGVTNYYLWDDRNPSGYAQVIEEWKDNGSGQDDWTSYNYGLALAILHQGNGDHYYGQDGHGNVRFLTDGSGNITDIYTYDAYGMIVAKTGPTTNNYLYCGQQYDSDLGLYYNRARYLNPDTGRFWTRDSFEGDNEAPLSLHKYLYGADNPVNLDDPTGHDFEMLAVMDIFTSFFAAVMPVSSSATSTAISLPALPTSGDGQLLTGIIFSESSSKGYGGGENEDEKDEMGLTVLNRTYYSTLKGPHGYWNGFMGNGSVLSALQAPSQFLAYNGPRWKVIMDGNKLKPASVLNKLPVDEKEHLRLSIEAANFCTDGSASLPTTLATLGDPPVPGKNPVAFNKAKNSPPGKRMEFFGRAGSHSFYSFKPGREAE